MDKRLSPEGTTIFVVGNSRSGTTMMGRILGNHDSVFTFHEILFFEGLVSIEDLDTPLSLEKANLLFANLISIQREGYLRQRVIKKHLPESAEVVKGLKEREELTPLSVFKQYLKYETVKKGRQIPCNQTPRNLLFLGADEIPLREALRSWANYHPYIVSRLWNSSIHAGENVEKGERILNVYFEELLEDPSATIRKICRFAGLEFNPKMLEIPQVGSSSAKDKPEMKGINSERALSWQKGGLTETELFICQNICSENMKKHGYEMQLKTNGTAGIVASYIILPFKLCLSLVLNFKRYKNLMSSAKRRFFT